MKKLTALFLALCLASVASGCNETDEKDPLQTTDLAVTTTVTTDPPQTTDLAVTSVVTTEPLQTTDLAVTTETSEPEPVFPDQSYVGVWATDESKTDEIIIYEITDDSVLFDTGVFRHFGFNATATLKDGELVFETNDGIKGKLEFTDEGVTVIYDSFGQWSEDFDYLGKSEVWPSEYKFTVRPTSYENSIEGLYYYTTDLFNADYRAENPGHNPYISFTSDGGCMMLVGYGRGMCGVNGTYQIEGNSIYVELDVENSYLAGIDVATGKPYMDDSYIFEIVDNNHIIIGPAPDSYYGGDCYVVKAGGSFIRE